MAMIHETALEEFEDELEELVSEYAERVGHEVIQVEITANKFGDSTLQVTHLR